MIEGVDRLANLVDLPAVALTGCTTEQIRSAVESCDVAALGRTDGHFAAVERDGKTVRMARTIGQPLRYFVAKMYHGPYLVAAERMDQLFAWCQEQRIGWQFDPAYTRMVPAHYLVEVDQVGCPDPAPRYHRFFNPTIGNGPEDIEEAGANYVRAAYEALKTWLATNKPKDANRYFFINFILDNVKQRERFYIKSRSIDKVIFCRYARWHERSLTTTNYNST